MKASIILVSITASMAAAFPFKSFGFGNSTSTANIHRATIPVNSTGSALEHAVVLPRNETSAIARAVLVDRDANAQAIRSALPTRRFRPVKRTKKDAEANPWKIVTYNTTFVPED